MVDRVSIRSTIADGLRSVLPSKWKVLPYLDDIDSPLNPVVMIGQSSVTKTPAAPLGARDLSLVARVVVPPTDPSKVDDGLEEALDTLLDSIEELSGSGLRLRWDSADKAIESNLPAYDVTLTVTVQHIYAQGA